MLRQTESDLSQFGDPDIRLETEGDPGADFEHLGRVLDAILEIAAAGERNQCDHQNPKQFLHGIQSRYQFISSGCGFVKF